ncbi:MAG: peroxide stress protein YaaA [Alphaproteobacteria bacterium]|nr:peroxide stress protein YaaA [Alphaproteobacteria bacterium]
MLLLLSPSKTQDFTNARTVKGLKPSAPALLKESLELLKPLKKLSASDLQGLMSISEKLAALNHARFKAFSADFTETNSKPAVFAFKGDVYDGLDADSLTDADLKFAQQHLRMLSGFYGILKPFDLMQPYRLEMGTKLANPRGKDLYAFWGERLTETLNAELAKSGKDTVVNLASQEYASAIQPKAINGNWVNVHFKEEKAGQLKVIGLFAKRARGAYARQIIRERIDTPEKLITFKKDGYRFRESLSTPFDLVFSRKAA